MNKEESRTFVFGTIRIRRRKINSLHKKKERKQEEGHVLYVYIYYYFRESVPINLILRKHHLCRSSIKWLKAIEKLRNSEDRYRMHNRNKKNSHVPSSVYHSF